MKIANTTSLNVPDLGRDPGRMERRLALDLREQKSMILLKVGDDIDQGGPQEALGRQKQKSVIPLKVRDDIDQEVLQEALDLRK